MYNLYKIFGGTLLLLWGYHNAIVGHRKAREHKFAEETPAFAVMTTQLTWYHSLNAKRKKEKLNSPLATKTTLLHQESGLKL